MMFAKIVGFAVGFAILFWALFYFGRMAEKTYGNGEGKDSGKSRNDAGKCGKDAR